ncbi:MAG: hypothetical protein K2P51_01385 [Rhabdochlamydiaceae bacterium]|nr:hypothetical protein [Rhabdochlamydiaceae bacterium]
MSSFRAIVHYKFKKGMEEQGMKFLENELIKKAQEYGCHGIEFWQNGKHSTDIIGIGCWNNIEEARKFQSHWDAKEKELMRYCEEKPHRQFYQVRSMFSEKSRKVA